jgi:hypothetical protein
MQNSSTPKKRATRGRKRVVKTAFSGPEDADDAASDAYSEQDDEHDVKSLLSDALDDDSDVEAKKRVGGKRKRVSNGKAPRAKGSSPRKRHKNAAGDEDDEGEVYELKEGQQVVGKVVQAPKTGRGQCYFYPPSFGANLPRQSLQVKYLKILSIFFCSSQNQSAMIVNGNDASTFVGRYVTDQ